MHPLSYLPFQSHLQALQDAISHKSGCSPAPVSRGGGGGACSLLKTIDSFGSREIPISCLAPPEVPPQLPPT